MSRSLVGACGLFCAECPIFIATASGDLSKKKLLAAKLSEELGKKIRPNSVTCWGCRATDRSCFGAACKYRSCARQKGIEYCYRCNKYACPDLNPFYVKYPQAQENLKRICKIGIEAFISEQSKSETESA